MKIRNGFVSNSSSSSFCILGAKFTREEFEKVLHGDEEQEEFDYDTAYDFANEHSFEFATGLEDYGDDSYFLGLAPGQLNEDISINENRKIIKDKLEEIGFSVTEVDWYIDSGYNT